MVLDPSPPPLLQSRPYTSAIEPNVSTKEPYISAKEPYVSAKQALYIRKKSAPKGCCKKYFPKSALYICKRAQHIHKKALYTRKRALCVRKTSACLYVYIYIWKFSKISTCRGVAPRSLSLTLSLFLSRDRSLSLSFFFVFYLSLSRARSLCLSHPPSLPPTLSSLLSRSLCLSISRSLVWSLTRSLALWRHLTLCYIYRNKYKVSATSKALSHFSGAISLRHLQCISVEVLTPCMSYISFLHSLHICICIQKERKTERYVERAQDFFCFL